MGSIPRLSHLKPSSWKAFFFCLALLIAAQTWALPLGMNKVRYHTDHHWQMFETEHFEIYYYQGCETLAKKAVEYAEDAFLDTSRKLGFVPKSKIPMFLYGTGLEFQETNITPELLGEGVGGFTEVFKNRISLPMSGSYHEFEKVLHHELTHAFQYDMIYGEGWRSVNLFKAVFVPNWMMEGMAEWNAQHLDAQGEMVLRDAVLNDQTIPLSFLESFEHFEQVYMAYKESQSILDYISQVYGADKVPQIFKKMTSNQQPDTAVKTVLGVSLDQLYEDWHLYMKTQAWSRINGMPAPERYGAKLEPGVSKSALSPDGAQLAYFKGEDLVLLDPLTKKKKTLLNGSFQSQGSGLAWSPDGKKLAFMTVRDGEYVLDILQISDNQLKEKKFKGLPVLYSPTWSPDGKFLVFSAFDYTTVDLYRYEPAGDHLDRMTNNPTTKSWAAYAPDGSSLFYIQEEGGETRVQKLDLGGNGLPQGEAMTVGSDLGTLSSLRIANGSFYFTSNRDKRIFNLYRMDLQGDHLTRLTNCFTDLLSVAPSPDGSTFYPTLYQKGETTLFSFSASKMDPLASPPAEGAYLSNSFDGASKVIPAPSKDMPVEAEMGTNFDKEKSDGEQAKDKKTPTQAPLAVTHLEVAEASNIVQLQWPIQLYGEVDVIDSYKIYRATESGAPFNYLGATNNLRQGKYVDYDVKAGGHYFYYITALNKAGESGPSPIVEAQPTLTMTPKDYPFRFTPDILLLLAGYDSSVGFVGGGIGQFSDYLGDHQLGILGDVVPGVETGIQANYQFSAWRTTVDLSFFDYQNFFNIYDLQSGNIVNQYRNNENGLALNFSYPLSLKTRFEYGVGTQRFQGSPLYLQFSEGISNYSQTSDQWNVANYYRLSFVQEDRKGTQFWPSSGYALNFTLLHALPVLDANVNFANLLLETQVFADLGFLNHMVWANRFIGMTSQGPNPQTFFIGNDAPFQAFFTTMRGYGGSTFFGSNLGLWNTELRYPLATHMNFTLNPLSFIMIKDIEIAGFADTGIVANQLQDLGNSPVLTSIGTGIRFYTFLYQRALVLLRFDVAWRMDQSAPPVFNFNLTPIF